MLKGNWKKSINCFSGPSGRIWATNYQHFCHFYKQIQGGRWSNHLGGGGGSKPRETWQKLIKKQEWSIKILIKISIRSEISNTLYVLDQLYNVLEKIVAWTRKCDFELFHKTCKLIKYRDCIVHTYVSYLFIFYFIYIQNTKKKIVYKGWRMEGVLAGGGPGRGLGGWGVFLNIWSSVTTIVEKYSIIYK